MNLTRLANEVLASARRGDNDVTWPEKLIGRYVSLGNENQIGVEDQARVLDVRCAQYRHEAGRRLLARVRLGIRNSPNEICNRGEGHDRRRLALLCKHGNHATNSRFNSSITFGSSAPNS